MRWRRAAMAAAAACAASVLPASSSSGEMSTALAIISVEPRDGGIEIAASAFAVTAVELTGELTISRKGSSGKVSTRQSRKLDLAAGEREYIARTGVNFVTGDELEVKVTLMEGDLVVAESLLTTRGN